MSNYDLIIEMKERFNLKSDYEAAKKININQSIMKRIRDEDKMSVVVKLKVLDKLGYAYARDALKAVLTQKEYVKYLESDR